MVAGTVGIARAGIDGSLGLCHAFEHHNGAEDYLDERDVQLAEAEEFVEYFEREFAAFQNPRLDVPPTRDTASRRELEEAFNHRHPPSVLTGLEWAFYSFAKDMYVLKGLVKRARVLNAAERDVSGNKSPLRRFIDAVARHNRRRRSAASIFDRIRAIFEKVRFYFLVAYHCRLLASLQASDAGTARRMRRLEGNVSDMMSAIDDNQGNVQQSFRETRDVIDQVPSGVERLFNNFSKKIMGEIRLSINSMLFNLEPVRWPLFRANNCRRSTRPGG